MRDAIAGYVRQIEEARQRLDHALEQVSGVSRALTTTTAGVPTLQQAVVRTAASIGGGPRSAVLAVREGDTDSLVTVATEGDPPPLSEWPGLDAVLSGQTLRLDHPEHGSLVAVPMFYQDRVVGTLATVTPAEGGVPVGDSDVDVLAVLANNAAIAMENARLFEQERDTVRRLLELDSMKTDFLATVQHELRTPLTAIMGLADLLEMCWDMWEEGPKLDAVRDIQVAAKNLYDIVETIIDYSVMEDEKLGLNPAPVPLRETIENTLALVGERYRGGLPVPVDVVGDASVTVFADAERLVQVVRARPRQRREVQRRPRARRGQLRARRRRTRGAHRDRRRGHRHPRRRPLADLRTLLPGGQHRHPQVRGHRHGARARPAHGRRRTARGSRWRAPWGRGRASSSRGRRRQPRRRARPVRSPRSAGSRPARKRSARPRVPVQ